MDIGTVRKKVKIVFQREDFFVEIPIIDRLPDSVAAHLDENAFANAETFADLVIEHLNK